MTVWQVDGWKLLTTFPAGPDYTTGAAVSPDGTKILIGGPNNARLVDVSDGKTLRVFGRGWVSGVGFLSDDVLMVRDPDQLGFWTSEGQLLCSDPRLQTAVLALTPAGGLVAGAMHQRDVMLWSAEKLKSCVKR